MPLEQLHSCVHGFCFRARKLGRSKAIGLRGVGAANGGVCMDQRLKDSVSSLFLGVSWPLEEPGKKTINDDKTSPLGSSVDMRGDVVVKLLMFLLFCLKPVSSLKVNILI